MNGISLKQYFEGQYPRNSRVARWDRRFLKGLVNFALFLALLGAALAILDVGFPYHWSKSTSVTTSMARQHWGYVNLDLAGPALREKLPNNVEPWGVSAAIQIDNPGLAEKALSRLASVPACLLVAFMIWILRSIVMTTVGTEDSEGDPFIRPNIRRLRLVALLLMLMPVIGEWSAMAELELLSRSIPKEFLILDFDFSSMFTFVGFGILALVMAEVLKIGIQLREDAEGLV